MANIDAFFNTQAAANQVQAGDIANRAGLFQIAQAERAAQQRDQGLAIQQKLAQEATRKPLFAGDPEMEGYAPDAAQVAPQKQQLAPTKSDTEKAADDTQNQINLLDKTINEYKLKGLPADQLQTQRQDLLIKGTALRRDAAKEKAETIDTVYNALNAVNDAETANIAWKAIPDEGRAVLQQKLGNILKTDQQGNLIYTPQVQKVFEQLSGPTQARKQAMDIAHQAAQEEHDVLVAKQTAERNAQQALNENRAAGLAREKFDLEKSQAKEGSGKPPSGYRYTAGGDLEPIPGGPADFKRQGAYNADIATLQSGQSDLDRLATAANELKEHPGLKSITGWRGVIKDIPGTDAANARAQLGTLKSQIGFSVLQAMRNASKTGGALGSVSDAEGKRLESNLAALDESQDVESFTKNLNKVIKFTEEAKARLGNAFNTKYSESPKRRESDKSATPPDIQDLLKKYGG